MSIFRRIGVTGAALLIAFACVVGMVLYVVGDVSSERAEKREEAERQAEEEQEDVDTGYIGCLRYNDTRLFLRDIIEDAYGSPAATGEVRAEAERLYAGVDDPDVQGLFGLLFTSQARGGRASGEEQRAKTGTRDCEAEYPNHSAGISITSVSTIPPPPLEPR